MNKKLKIYIYSFLTTIGFVLPNIIVYEIFKSTGNFDFFKLFDVYNLNLYAKFLSIDFSITALTYLVFYWFIAHEKKIKFAYLPIIGTFLVGVSFGFPLLLLLKEI